jgi:hemerythrin-like domain-containing protein
MEQTMPRQETFTLIHKGLRTLIYRMGSTIQSADFSDPAVMPSLVAGVDHGLEILAEHGGHEERFVFPRLVGHAPELVDTAYGHHKEIHGKIESLHRSLRTTAEEQDATSRVEAGEQLNRELNDFLALYLSHLCFEENFLQPVTYRALTDEEIIGIRVAIQKSMLPEPYEEFLRVVIASASNPELVSILAGTKAGAPPPALQHLVELLEQVLPPGRVHMIRERAGV